MQEIKTRIQIFVLYIVISYASCQQLIFEIKNSYSQNDLSAMNTQLDFNRQNILFQKHSSLSKYQTQNSKESNNDKQTFKRKFLSHANFNQDPPQPNKPVHGNSTNFSLYTSYGNAYLVNIYVGSESQEYQVLLDTGSSYTWLTHQNCTTCVDLNIKKYFDCEKSTTCANQKQTVEIDYGQGKVYAAVYRDKIGFYHNKFIANNQDFLLVYKLDGIPSFPGQGLFGLGFASLSDGRKTILDNLKEQGQITKRQFAFSLSGEAENVKYGKTNKDFFILGGDAIDPNLADESDYFSCPVIYKPYWAIAVQNIKPIISDLEINLHMTAQVAIVDSGTSFIILNQQDFQLLVSFFMKLKKLNCELDVEYNLVKCQSTERSVYPTFKITLCEQSRHILIYPQQYLLCDEKSCLIRISGIDFGFTIQKFIILGDIFLRTQYTVFNQDDMTISFYKKKVNNQSQEQTQFLKDNLDSSLQMGEEKSNKYYKQHQQKIKESIDDINERIKLKKELKHTP